MTSIGFLKTGLIYTFQVYIFPALSFFDSFSVTVAELFNQILNFTLAIFHFNINISLAMLAYENNKGADQPVYLPSLISDAC